MDLTKLLGLPIVASSHGQEIDMMIVLVHLLMLVLFIGWGIFFTIALFKFNRKSNPKANYSGVHSHVSSYIEVAVAVVEVILLVGFSIPFWAKQVNAFPTRTDRIEIKVVAEQFAWNFQYPGKDGIFGHTDAKFFDKQSNPMGLDPNDPAGKDDFTAINQLHIPIGRPVVLHLTSRDVIHSFGVPLMRVKQDANPGLSIPMWFTPTQTGQFEIVCSQLCGLGHYRMKGVITVLAQEDFDKWYTEQSASTAGEDGEGSDSFWN